MKNIIYIPFVLLLLLSSCTVHYTSLDVDSNENVDLIQEYETDYFTYNIVTIEDDSRAFAITKLEKDDNPAITTVTENEYPNLNMSNYAFALKEIKTSGLESYYTISCLRDETYLSSFVRGNELYLFTYIYNYSQKNPYSVFMRIVDIKEKKLLKEKVILRKYFADFEDWQFSLETNTYTPSLKVAPNKEYFAIYMAHDAGDLMSVWTIDIFDKEGERINRRVLNRKGTIDFSIENDGSLWRTGMYMDNYSYHYNVEHINGVIFSDDSYEIPKVKNSKKQNNFMLSSFNARSYSEDKYKYFEFYFPTNQNIVKNKDHLVFFNYMYGNHGNGGIVATIYDKKKEKIDSVKLTSYIDILDASSSNNSRFYPKFIPDLKLTNVILDSGNYYLVLENFVQRRFISEGVLYILGYAGDKYIVALDKNFKLKWANTQSANHQYFMTSDNFTDQYSLQGASTFEVKDGKLSGIISGEFATDSFWGYEDGYFRVNYDLETGKLLDSKLLVNITGNSKIFYNNFYKFGDMKLIIDQNNRDEIYLIKEK